MQICIVLREKRLRSAFCIYNHFRTYLYEFVRNVVHISLEEVHTFVPFSYFLILMFNVLKDLTEYKNVT